MDLKEALDVVVARTGHARFRDLCDPDHPAYNPAYEATVLRMAAEPDPRSYPPLWKQAVNLAREATGHALRGAPAAAEGLAERRLAVCRGCEHFDHAQERCFRCGCYMRLKAAWAYASCPLDPPRWGPENS